MCCESCKKTKSLEKEIQQLKKAQAILKVESNQRYEQIRMTFRLLQKVAHRAGIADDAVEVDIWEIQHKRRQQLAEKN